MDFLNGLKLLPAPLDRNLVVGGSDIGNIVGVGYVSQNQVWCERKGILPRPEFSPKQQEKLNMGKLMEPIIVGEFCRRKGWSYRRVEHTLRMQGLAGAVAHPDALDFIASIDAVLLDTPDGPAIGDCKNSEEDWQYRDGLPPHYNCQLQWYMGITGLKVAYLIILIGGYHIEGFRVDRDDELIHAMRIKAREFLDSLALDLPPDLSHGTIEEIRACVPVAPQKTIIASAELEEAIAEYEELRRKRLDETKILSEAEAEARRRVELLAEDAARVQCYSLGVELVRGVQNRTRYDVPDDVKEKYASRYEIPTISVKKLKVASHV